MNNLSPEFGDNVLVQRHRYGNEYLAISLRPATEPYRFSVYVYRYTVPGRCDTYSFQWTKPEFGVSDVRYYSEDNLPLAKALKLIELDFNRPAVIEMCLEAFRAERIVLHYRRDFLLLLSIVAPKSKTYRAVKKLCDKTMEERAARIAGERGKEILQSVE